jgi:hypothetical protein
MKILLQLVLWVIIGALGYLLFNAVYGEVKFNEIKEQRYQQAITNLKDIRAAQLAHKTVTGKYEGDFNKLVKFIDTAKFTLTQRRDSTVLDKAQTRAFGVDTYKGIVIIDTLGYRSIKDSLFKAPNPDRYKTMINIPIEGLDAKYEMQAGTIEKTTGTYPVFEAKVSKDVLLWDQSRDYVIKEKQVQSVDADAVSGEYVSVGSMIKIDTRGNWGKSYGADDE